MTESPFCRTALLLGEQAVERLAKGRVAVFGVGGVGSYAAEALARAGIGRIDLVDHDVVSLSNLNRQLVALHSTIGQPKVSVCRARLRDINPALLGQDFPILFTPETAGQIDFSEYDYVIDAIDTVTGKLELICKAEAAGTRVISCMGAGNKLDPTRFTVCDIYETSVCPLARIMRQELKKRGIASLRVVYSTEPARRPVLQLPQAPEGSRRSTPGSLSYVPSVAGLIAAGEVIRALAQVE